jgi:hypothetical protein
VFQFMLSYFFAPFGVLILFITATAIVCRAPFVSDEFLSGGPPRWLWFLIALAIWFAAAILAIYIAEQGYQCAPPWPFRVVARP